MMDKKECFTILDFVDLGEGAKYINDYAASLPITSNERSKILNFVHFFLDQRFKEGM